MVSYVPERGDIAWLDFDPQVGTEIAKRRPCLILSPRSYNKLSCRAVAMPITSQAKGHPFEVQLPDDCQIKGVIITDQVKSICWTHRNIQYATSVDFYVVDDALINFEALVKTQYK